MEHLVLGGVVFLFLIYLFGRCYWVVIKNWDSLDPGIEEQPQVVYKMVFLFCVIVSTVVAFAIHTFLWLFVE